MLADPGHDRLFMEIRNNKSKKVSFSALHVGDGQWIWREVTLEEPWWVTLAAVSDQVVFFTLYTDTDNPDKKSALALDIRSQKILWWRNNFAISTVSGRIVTGIESKFGGREIALSVTDGSELGRDTLVLGEEQNFKVLRPFQYHAGSEHFKTVSAFLEKKQGFSSVITVEYIEYGSLIVLSAFTGSEDLANYLFVFNSAGELLLKETLGGQLKGIALDTFFIFSGYLIFVKNKSELVCYKVL